jgi:L-ribulose-5-phosphate 4-epimerase
VSRARAGKPGKRGATPPAATTARVKDDIVLACHILEAAEQGDTVYGHVSARDPGGRGFWMKPASRGLDEIRAADLILLDLDGNVLAGTRQRHLEYPIHSEIYRARPDVQSVVHTHPEHATVFSALRVPLRPVSHEACLFVPPDVPRYSETSDLIVTAALGQSVARTLGAQWALLLESHGIVTAGPGVADACLRALMLDKAARVQLLAGGREKTWTSDDEALIKRDRIYSPRGQANVWAYLTRSLARRRRARPAPPAGIGQT